MCSWGWRNSRPGAESSRIEGLEQHVGAGHGLEREPGQDPRQLPAEAGVEPATAAAIVGVGEHEASEGQVPAQRLHLGRGEGRELAVAAEVQEGVIEQPRTGEGQRASLGDHLHRGAALQLPGEPAQAGQSAVPPPPVLATPGTNRAPRRRPAHSRPSPRNGRLRRSVRRENGNAIAAARGSLTTPERSTAAPARFILRPGACIDGPRRSIP